MRKYKIDGMSCAACSSRVERAVRALDGVQACSVNLLTGTMELLGEVKDEQIMGAVKNAGYSASPYSEKTKKEIFESTEEKKLLRRFLFSLIFLLPLMYITMGHLMLSLPLPYALESSPLAIAITELVLSLIILIINYRFFVSGIAAVLHAAPNMDTLVSLGSLVSFLWSVYLLVGISASQDPHSALHGLYFESAAMILTLITLGKTLEARAKGKTTSAIKELLLLTPDSASVIRDGEEIRLSRSEILLGDTVVVRAGERVALDGVIVYGSASLDESALTGEGIPADKGVGDKVFGASVNLSGLIHFEVTALENDTAMSKIIKLVEDASTKKAPIAKLADRVSGIFVPIVLILASLTVLSWLLINGEFSHALMRGISVLVISCPCALGLATPVAVMVGSGVGARRGILFKSGEALEALARVKTVAFDKTGTLTSGAPRVSDIIPISASETELLSLACTLEEGSEHPLGKAIFAYGAKRGVNKLSVCNFKTLAGLGVYAEILGKPAYGASFSFVNSQFALSPDTVSIYTRLAESGKTPVFFTHGEGLIGIIALFDTVKDDAKETVTLIHSLGLDTVMISGDNEKSAGTVARELGIDRVYASVLPDEKEKIIRTLSENGGVIMVGDGINDAPALSSATVGVAIGTGTDIAIESAGVVLSSPHLTDVYNAIKLGRSTLRNVKQNLFWAFFYNILGIPLAMGVFTGVLNFELSPMLGALAMSLSSLFVVSNALRLNTVILKSHTDKTQVKETREDIQMIKILKIEGIMCQHCEARVKSALEALPFVSFAEVSHESGTATVTLTKEDDSALRNAVSNAGYNLISIEKGN